MQALGDFYDVANGVAIGEQSDERQMVWRERCDERYVTQGV